MLFVGTSHVILLDIVYYFHLLASRVSTMWSMKRFLDNCVSHESSAKISFNQVGYLSLDLEIVQTFESKRQDN